MVLHLIRYLLQLPARRCESRLETSWIAMPDGVRLATFHFWPVATPHAPSLMIRTPYGVRSRPRVMVVLGHLLAQYGYHVILQDVRGRYESEGRFTPFEHEADDGKATLDWIAAQSWFQGKVGLIGASYLGYSAWAALSEAPELIGAIVVMIGSRDLYATFYPGGALALSNVFDWGVGVGQQESVPERQIDRDRALRFRPLREADRVGLRTVGWYRDWLDHPRRDGYWDGLCPPLPAKATPSLLVAGWYDFFLGPQLADHSALTEIERSTGGVAPRLVIGPWAQGRVAHQSWRRRGNGLAGVALRETIRFIDRHLDDERGTRAGESGPRERGTRAGGSGPRERGTRAGESGPRVRYFTSGGNGRWQDAAFWPPPSMQLRALYLHRSGDAAGDRATRRLDWEVPAAAEATDQFRSDPSNPVPSLGGALIRKGGAVDQTPVEARSDVISYSTAPLPDVVEIAGPVRVVLFASSSAPDTDFTAKLVDVTARDRTLNICEGIVRARWRAAAPETKDPEWLGPGEPARFEIDLWAAGHVFQRGHRIRLEIASSNFPRFDRNPGTRDDPVLTRPESFQPTEQIVHHDADHPSHVLLPVLNGDRASAARSEP